MPQCKVFKGCGPDSFVIRLMVASADSPTGERFIIFIIEDERTEQETRYRLAELGIVDRDIDAQIENAALLP
jgi:hypothetical protein